MNRKEKTFIKWSEGWFSILVVLVLAIIIFIYNKPLGVVAMLSTAGIAMWYQSLMKSKEKELIQIIEGLDQCFGDSTRAAVFNMPFPIAMTNQIGTITWYNSKFKTLFPKQDIMGRDISKMIPAIQKEDLEQDSNVEMIPVKMSDSAYNFYMSVAQSIGSKEKTILFYGVDNTQDMKIREAYEKSQLIVMVIHIDNYDEFRVDTEESNRLMALAEIDRLINVFAKDYQGIIRKYETDKYLGVFTKENLEKIIQNKFSIIDQVKEMRMGNAIPATLSIGIGATEDTPFNIYKVARLAIDVALGRGGDQVVLNDGENIKYFGGKNKAQEKRNKVKSRVISHALIQLIDSANEVFIMGHKNPDMDSFGSCLGIYEMVNMREKKVFIVLNEVTPAIENLYAEIEKVYPEVLESIITEEEAYDLARPNSLVVVLDNHRKNSTEAPNLLELVDQVVLLDHHRRGADYIADPTLTYLEPYASSTAELVTELINYMDEPVHLPKIVAEGLLAGIMVDTKNFYYQTGVRTFEAASILKRFGADSLHVKNLFKDDADVVIKRASVISGAEMVRSNIAIGILDESTEDSVLIAAQAADQLLEIKEIKASFVLTDLEDKIHISGRSVGDISVQLILEKIGGGGHLTSAGAQINTRSMDEAKQQLMEAIDAYLDEEEENESHT